MANSKLAISWAAPPVKNETFCWVCRVSSGQMLLGDGHLSDGTIVPACRSCVAAVPVVESLRNTISILKQELDNLKEADSANKAIAAKVVIDRKDEDDDDDNINRKSWNKAIRAAAEEAAHDSYNKNGDGVNYRIADAILELRKSR